MRRIQRLTIVPVVVLGLAAFACDESSSTSPSTSSSASAPVTGTPPALATAPAHGAASASPAPSASAAASPPPAASPPDPQDAKLGGFEHEVAQAIVNAATGKPVDAKWVSKDPAQSVSKLTDPDDKKLIDVLGKDLTIVLVEMELGELAQPSPQEHHEINGRAILLADNTVRWGTVGNRHQAGELSEPTPGLDKSAPVAVEAGNRLIKALAGTCKMPWLAPSDVAQVPAEVQTDLVTDVAATNASCAEVAKVKGDWRAHIDDIRVLVKGNGHYGYLSSIFSVEDPGSRLVLAPLHAEVIQDAQLKKP